MAEDELHQKSEEELHAMLDKLTQEDLPRARAHVQRLLEKQQKKLDHHLDVDFKVGDALQARYRGSSSGRGFTAPDMCPTRTR